MRNALDPVACDLRCWRKCAGPTGRTGDEYTRFPQVDDLMHAEDIELPGHERTSLGSAGEIPIADLTALFNQAYADYFVPIVLTEPSFREMVVNFDHDLEASRLLVDGAGPRAFALLGVRGKRGWIGGMGVLPAHRGQGLGRAVMDAVSEAAQSRGLTSIDLEVLVQNAPAIAVYESLGYRDVRELDVWVREAVSGGAEESLDAGARNPGPAVRPVAVEACLERHARFHREPAPWQRDHAVLTRLASSLQALGVGPEDEPRCWVIYRRHENTLRIADVALAEDAPVNELEAVLDRLIRESPGASATLVNLSTTDRAREALANSDFVVRWLQREMRLEL